tara:strand:- start:112 stop:537 length:426 start_codon:yes stop_codon:yes gene_type:complete
MEKIILILLVNILSFDKIYAQDNNELNEYGFIDIKTDSMDVPFFVDGYYVGNHPLKEPVPVIPGFHEVSYIPPDIQDEKIKDNLSEGIKRIYIAANDTLEVFLYYDHYLSQIETLNEEFKVQKYVGFALFGMLIYLLLSIL